MNLQEILLICRRYACLYFSFMTTSRTNVLPYSDWPDEDRDQGNHRYQSHAPGHRHHDVMIEPNAVWTAGLGAVGTGKQRPGVRHKGTEPSMVINNHPSTLSVLFSKVHFGQYLNILSHSICNTLCPYAGLEQFCCICDTTRVVDLLAWIQSQHIEVHPLKSLFFI